jgi:hypothetical protein
LLFSPRPSQGKAPNTEAHAKLCATVLEIFDAAGRELGPKFSLDTWHTVLKIVLGMCDHLLKAPEDQSPLATMLCPQLVKVRHTGLLRVINQLRLLYTYTLHWHLI